MINSSGESFFQTSSKMIIGRSIMEFIPFSSPVISLIDNCIEKESSYYEYNIDLTTPKTGIHKDVDIQISKIVNEFSPHIVFCPYPDRHVDHRLVFDSLMVATRPIGVGKKIEIIAAYETLSETHWNAPHIEPNFTPNWIIDITENIEKKLKALRCYKSQISEFPNPRSIEAVEALAKFRGTQAGFGFGEGMHIIRKIS